MTDDRDAQPTWAQFGKMPTGEPYTPKIHPNSYITIVKPDGTIERQGGGEVMEEVDKIVHEMHDNLMAALGKYPNTPEARSAMISVLMVLVSDLAQLEPEAVRRHWARFLYQQADRLAAPPPANDRH